MPFFVYKRNCILVKNYVNALFGKKPPMEVRFEVKRVSPFAVPGNRCGNVFFIEIPLRYNVSELCVSAEKTLCVFAKTGRACESEKMQAGSNPDYLCKVNKRIVS